MFSLMLPLLLSMWQHQNADLQKRYLLHAHVALRLRLYYHGIADFDLVLRDTCFWPGAMIQDMLGIDSVELWPTALLLPWL